LMRTIRISLLLALAMLAIVAGTTRGQDNPAPLFTADVAPDDSPTADASAQRQYVTIDLSLLDIASGAGDDESGAVRLDLSNGLRYTALFEEVERPATGQIVWHGRIEGQPDSPVTIAVRDGVTAGSIWADGRLHRLYHAGDGVHVLEALEGGEPMPEHPPIPVEPADNQEPVTRDGQSAASDDGSVVEVLVVYTTASRVRYGGKSGIEALINLAVAETNQAYASSLINTRLSLVAAVEVAYSESGNMIEDLHRLQRTSDGHLDSVHALRDAYAADTVTLIEEASDYCGIAFLMTTLSNGFETHAFSVVDSDCATGYYSFGHELGHNMGSHHNRETFTSTPATLFDYSFGYLAPDSSFRTIMAYNCSVGCIRVQRFSNPDVYYNGQPTGVRYSSNPSRAANNARSINEASFTVANWRDSSTRKPAAPTGLVAVAKSPTRIDLAWQDNAGNETGYDVQRRIPGQSWVSIASLPVNSSNYVDGGCLADTSYEYRVRSYRDSDYSDYSNVAGATTLRYPEVHVGEINGAGIFESNPAAPPIIWRASITILAHDAYHRPVAGARVDGAWSGGVSGGDWCMTGGDGHCTVTRPGLDESINSATFSVSSITFEADPYKPDHNHDPGGDGSTLTVNRPVEAIYFPFVGRD
jgi:hypothetical protein